MYMEKLYINIMSCCNCDNAKQNAQNNELHQNENKCADHKYVTTVITNSCPHGPYLYIHKHVFLSRKKSNKPSLVYCKVC